MQKWARVTVKVSQPVSIKDIARAAGVSHSTVSRALLDSPLISASTRARIQRLARDMAYMPNAIARSLQTQRTHTIGVVVTSLADPFFADVVEGVEAVAKPTGLSLFLGISHNDPERELEVMSGFHQRRVDAILVATSQLNEQHSAQLAGINVPVVTINAQVAWNGIPYHSVSVDDAAGARRAVEHLLTLGHRRVGYLGVGNRPGSNLRRLRGYREALEAAGLTPAPEWVLTPPPPDRFDTDDAAVGYEMAPLLLDSGVSAIFCYNDVSAIGLLRACHERGLSVPGDLSVVGFDDIPLASYLTPPLTTLHQPKRRMGRKAMGMLLCLLQGHAVEDFIFEPTLELRASTGAVRDEEVPAR
jgi:LacI family transcriptional regulator/LacI family repressor for deo operon, udp, cdd, tsx, nupC, and nupG